MRSAAERQMSAAEQFKAAVTSVSGPDQGWRGGLERSRAGRGRPGGAALHADRG